MKKKDKVKFDLILLILIPLVSALFSLIFRSNFLTSTLLFFGLPSLYLSLRTKKAIWRSLIFAVSFSIFMVLTVDHLGVLDNSWYVPYSVISSRIFGTIPLEDVIWSFLLTYFIVIFYEHFFDKAKHRDIGSHLKYFSYITISLLSIFLLLLFSNSKLLKIDYFYLKAGLLFTLIPSLAFLVEFPKFVSKFMKTAPYFFYVGLLVELVGLQLNQWTFPGKHFIGWVTISGQTFPFEELFFFISIFAICVLTYFEFFDDDKLLKTGR
jgi:hypothetical protein